MSLFVEKGDDQTRLRLMASRPRPAHIIVAIVAFLGSLALFYLMGIGNPGVWLGLAVLIGFVLVWGYLGYREAGGAAIRVSEEGLRLPPPATRGESERVLAPHEIKNVRRIRLWRRRKSGLSIVEIEDVNGRKVRLWPNMVSTDELARAIERHMGFTVESKSGLLYQVVFGVGILVVFFLVVVLYVLYFEQ